MWAIGGALLSFLAMTAVGCECLQGGGWLYGAFSVSSALCLYLYMFFSSSLANVLHVKQMSRLAYVLEWMGKEVLRVRERERKTLHSQRTSLLLFKVLRLSRVPLIHPVLPVRTSSRPLPLPLPHFVVPLFFILFSLLVCIYVTADTHTHTHVPSLYTWQLRKRLCRGHCLLPRITAERGRRALGGGGRGSEHTSDTLNSKEVTLP
jgi:hypothetical protein